VVPSDYKIRLEGIRFRGRHGVSDSERDLPQDFLVTIHVALPVTSLPAGDSVRDVFDYDRLATIVVDEGTSHTCRLLETLARRVIDRILRDTPATWVSVSVTKGRPPTTYSVDAAAVELVASRASSPSLAAK
jgi:dihydroneopterin aldolase